MHILLLIFTSFSFASSISIPLNDSTGKMKPANDLIYKNKKIDSVTALKLKENGIDISNLNPKVSNLYLNKRLHIRENRSLADQSDFDFLTFKSSPTEIFRFIALDQNNQKRVLTASLDNHTNIIRALLLRLIGYDINRPTLKEKVKISFTSKKMKKAFLEKLGEQTLSSRSRWIESETKKTVTLRFIIIDESELKNVNLYLPVMTRSRQQSRRVFRSLIALYSITDLNEAINKIDWNIGSIFNGNLSITHPYASQFQNTDEDDLKWILKKISFLSRRNLEDIVEEAKYPIQVKEIILEKLISRINTLNQKLKLKTRLNANLNLTNRYVTNGKLNSIKFENSVLNYSSQNVRSPYRFKELFRLFGTQAVYGALSSLLESGLESIIPGVYNSDANSNIQQQINDYRRENPTEGGTLPLKVFSAPTAFGRLIVNRNIVFGQVLDTVAPIQLVDSIGAEVNLGIQNKLTGISNDITPNIGINASVIRTYSHVRAMPDLKTATKQKVSNLIIPGLMKKLGKIIKDEYSCSISENPFVEEKKISQDIIYTIKYDKKDPKFQKLALKLRQKLISSGILASKIIFLKIDRDNLCSDDIQSTREKSINEFLKSFAENETFVISDSLRLNGLANVPIPLMSNMNLNLGADSSRALIRSIFLKKVEDSIQVTIQEQNDKSLNISESLSFYIRLVRNSNLFLKSKQEATFYNIFLKEENNEKKSRALRVIRNLFVRNDKSELYKHYKGEDIRHNVNVKLHSLNILWFKKDKFRMGHDLSVIIPNRGNDNFSLKDRTRKFFQYLDYKRSGQDFHSFANDILGYFSELVTLGQASPDPGKTFLGNSKKEYYSTEAELTQGYDQNVTTRIEFIRSGWSKKSPKMIKYFNEIDEMFSFSRNYNPMNKTILKGSTKLKSYDLRTTIILYPSAIDRIYDKIMNISLKSQTRLLSYLNNNQGEYLKRRGKKTLKLLRRFSKSFSNIKEKVKLTNQIYKHLFKKFNRSKLLALIGEENFFATTRVMGFLENHHEGALQYTADTIGKYNQNIGTGTLDKIASDFGISSFQIRALNYAPGM